MPFVLLLTALCSGCVEAPREGSGGTAGQGALATTGAVTSTSQASGIAGSTATGTSAPATSNTASTSAPDCDRFTAGAAHGAVTDARVEVETSKGRFVMDLYPDHAPITTANFLAYVEDGFYDGTLIHRIIKDFMAQGGQKAEDGTNKQPTRAPIENEARASGCHNLEYTLSMARTSDPDSATTQYFVNTKDNPFLDAGSGEGYAVFGVVTEGRSVIDAIESVAVGPYGEGKPCQPDSQPSCPNEKVVVESMEVM